ncbi:unnamed protein product [Acanthoscelides obtectus]|uniref:Uncharacterized protein n=1 Tax=Acanthoscelides obtectus TaxID=200917 RepID=A0A9P0PKS6_ACAOB|nr:unnamed protein product [Acanthoscelides obtectus]CAK1650203.1 hypothetical protein AOBTE_LOCUS16681 [Acanthoscelides obtectus]
MDNVVKNIQPEKKKKREQCKKNEIEQDVLLKKAATLMTKPTDEFQIFGDLVASESRNLKSPEYQRQLKLTIQRAIVQFSELDVSSPSTSGNSSCLSSRPQSAASYYMSFVANTQEDNVREHRTMHYNTQEQSPQSFIQGFGISTLTNDMNHLQQLP